jgi:hypothetical protein
MTAVYIACCISDIVYDMILGGIGSISLDILSDEYSLSYVLQEINLSKSV